MKGMITGLLVGIVIVTLGFLPEHQEKYSLWVGGYGYEPADVVLIDTEKAPEVRDIVIFNDRDNNSDFGAFGPGVYIARIIGLSGDKVIFSEYSYEVNEYIGRSRSDKHPISDVIWGDVRYDGGMENMTLYVPDTEFLADKWIGYEYIPSETSEFGDSLSYNRFTVKEEAIIGVIIKKIGHDSKLEEEIDRTLW